MRKLRLLIGAASLVGCALAADDPYVIDLFGPDEAGGGGGLGGEGGGPEATSTSTAGSSSSASSTGAHGGGEHSTSAPPPPPPDPCTDGSKDGSETDVDCGGTCPPCADGGSCKKDRDCTSDKCHDKKCEGEDDD